MKRSLSDKTDPQISLRKERMWCPPSELQRPTARRIWRRAWLLAEMKLAKEREPFK
jgi:hypothetical protein